MPWYYFKHMFEVVIRLQIIRLSRFGQTICNRAGFCSIHGIDQMPVILAHAEASYCYFSPLCSYENNGAYTQDNIFYLRPQILANSSSLFGHSGCSEFNSGLLLSMADLIISSDGFAYILVV